VSVQPFTRNGLLAARPSRYPPDWCDERETHRRVAERDPRTFLCWNDEIGTHLITANSGGIRNSIATGRYQETNIQLVTFDEPTQRLERHCIERASAHTYWGGSH